MDTRDPAIAALNANIEILTKQIDRLFEADRGDHDALTRLDRDLRQAFIEIKGLREDFLSEQRAMATRCDTHNATCTARAARSPDDIRAEERARAEEREWRAKVLARLDVQDAKWALVKTNATGAGKFALTLLGGGAGGGAAVKILDWLVSWWGKP